MENQRRLPRYRKDQLVPLACGGPDVVSNLQWQTIADANANLIATLDETLRDYGDSALPPRRLLRSYTELFMQILWPKTGAAGELGESGSAGALMERVRETIRALVFGEGGRRSPSGPACFDQGPVRGGWLPLLRRVEPPAAN
jgi:hypothetical protein